MRAETECVGKVQFAGSLFCNVIRLAGKAVAAAEELGLEEGKDFFLIKDSCLTELEPEEYDENGVGRTLTCIGFRPLPDSIAHKISRKYQLYR